MMTIDDCGVSPKAFMLNGIRPVCIGALGHEGGHASLTVKWLEDSPGLYSYIISIPEGQ